MGWSKRASGGRDSALPAILIGRDGRDYLAFDQPEHVALLARTGSGKTTSFSIPNAFNWPGSLVMLDVKGEVYKATAGHRAYALGQKVYNFNPTAVDERSHCWNPLDVVDRTSSKRFDELWRQIYLMIPDPKRGSDGDSSTFWQQSARMALYGVALLLAEMPEEEFTFGNVLTKVLRGDGLQWMIDAIERRRARRNPFSELAVLVVSDYIGRADRLTESIRKSVTTNLQAFVNPHNTAATNRSDFDLRNIRREPTSIYVTTSPGDIPRVEHLLRLLFGSVINLNTDVTPEVDPSLNVPVLIILDEFARLGAMPTLTQAAQFARGYGIRLAYIIQDKAQLIDLYGTAGAADVFSNLGVEIVFGTGDIKLAQEYEQRLGDYTLSYDTSSQSRFFPWFKWGQMKSNQHFQRRPLVLDQELVMMPPDEQLIVRPGVKPIRSKRICSYRDETFTALVCDAPEVPKLDIRIARDRGDIELPTIGPSPASPPPNPHGGRPPADPRHAVPGPLFAVVTGG